MNNAVFGKIMENVRNYTDNELVKQSKQKGIIWGQNQPIKQFIFSRWLISNRNKKDIDTHDYE